MLSRNTFLTIITKILILLINFILVVFTTRIWGGEGRGEIALVIANISLITIFSNVFCGSTVTYHAPGLQRDFLLGVSLAGATIVSFSGAVIFSAFFGSKYFLALFLIALLISLNSAISTYWLGTKKINKYNFLNLSGPLLILIMLGVLYYTFNETSLRTYFRAYYLAYGILLAIGIALLADDKPFVRPVINPAGFKSMFTYGISNEFNYLLQFINYRLSYYFIASMLGLARLGVFSIVVAITEAVWIISRSMSAIHFTNVINSDDRLKSRSETILFARQSFIISASIMAVAILVPDKLYQIIFGDEFTGLRKYILYLFPGIIAIAVSNLYGHYFAGSGRLNILRNKSLIGLAASLILLPLLVKKHQLTGACFSLDVSYILSSLYLWVMFNKEKQSVKDVTSSP
jgi:O-antigen/teichoic acid export membrane protein